MNNEDIDFILINFCFLNIYFARMLREFKVAFLRTRNSAMYIFRGRKYGDIFLPDLFCDSC